MDNAKAQASIEFLATYGWALLGLFFVLAYLLGTGILSPSRFSSEECSFQPGFSCSSFYLSRSGASSVAVGLTITNKLGYAVLLNNYSVLVGDRVAACSNYTCGSNVTLQPGASTNMLLPVNGITGGVSQNEFRRALISINYTNCADYVLASTPQTGYYTVPCPTELRSCLGNMSTHIASGRIMANVRR